MQTLVKKKDQPPAKENSKESRGEIPPQLGKREDNKVADFLLLIQSHQICPICPSVQPSSTKLFNNFRMLTCINRNRHRENGSEQYKSLN